MRHYFDGEGEDEHAPKQLELQTAELRENDKDCQKVWGITYLSGVKEPRAWYA